MACQDCVADMTDMQAQLLELQTLIVCGKLTGELPTGFLDKFNDLPDCALEHVWRFMPRQVPKLRLVCKKWDSLIKKSSKSMPKVMFSDNDKFGLKCVDTVLHALSTGLHSIAAEWCRLGAPLSELLRFVAIRGTLIFDCGPSATTEILEQLMKPWLDIAPNTIVFTCDFGECNKTVLRTFISKMSPRIVHYHDAIIPDHWLDNSLLPDRLDALIIAPKSPTIVDIDDAALECISANFAYLMLKGCPQVTIKGIRNKWINSKELSTVFGGIHLALSDCAALSMVDFRTEFADIISEETHWGDQLGFTVTCPPNNRLLNVSFTDEEFERYRITIAEHRSTTNSPSSYQAGSDYYGGDDYDFDYDNEGDEDYDDFPDEEFDDENDNYEMAAM